MQSDLPILVIRVFQPLIERYQPSSSCPPQIVNCSPRCPWLADAVRRMTATIDGGCGGVWVACTIGAEGGEYGACGEGGGAGPHDLHGALARVADASEWELAVVEGEQGDAEDRQRDAKGEHEAAAGRAAQ